jgi:hypothetical protein
LGGDFANVSWSADREFFPIRIIAPTMAASKSYLSYDNRNRECDNFKISILQKAIYKIISDVDISRQDLDSSFSSILLSKDQAERLLSDAKIKFYNIEVDEMTKKYNL